MSLPAAADSQGGNGASGCSAAAAGGDESPAARAQAPALSPPALAPGLDLDAWKGDLQRLHGTIDQVVQSFISSQTRQLDTVAAELVSQRERIMLKEQRFTELSDSIASFVEEEARRLEACGIVLNDPEADARHEAYDAELPGPPALHRINRLWRKATRAFEAAREANERSSASALEEQRRELEARVAAAEARCEALSADHAAQVAALEVRLEALRGEGQQRDGELAAKSAEARGLEEQLAAAKAELMQTALRLEQAEVVRSRTRYEWDAERDELTRERGEAQGRVAELERAVAEAGERERELVKTCADRADKLEHMRRIMDEQERELNQKIERVQQYVKERQASALHAEKKQQDAERLAERWQGEVRRLQAEKEQLGRLVLDAESRQSGQATEYRGACEQLQQEAATLREALRRKEEEMRGANLELLQRRDEEYQAKVNLERQREKERSIAMLRKKEQEVHIKDQQLRAARQRIQELEGAVGCGGGSGSGGCGSLASTATASPGSSSRGSTAGAVRRIASMSGSCDVLPPLPLSAR